MTDLLATLNEAQREAVTAPDGPVLVVAGAGSGKTRVLTTRIAWLLDHGVHPAHILAFTFTNRAAAEMRGRVDAMVGGARAPRWVGTFHATGVRLLRADGAPLGVDRDFAIYDADDSVRLIKSVMSEARADPKIWPPKQARSRISRWKSEDLPPERAAAEAGDHRDEQLARIYAAYERGLRRANALDFDDLILRTVHLLERHPEVLEKYAQRFRHVLVDEFQDTNPLQLLLVKALSSGHGNVFAVGDDDQSIYSWRGACIENMLNFESYFPGTRLVRLEQNYRSTGNILAAANAVIANNRRRKGKNLWTADAAGELLLREQLGDEEDEAARLAEIVREETARGGRRGDVTVLYRTNAQSRVLEDALRRARTPYQVVGATAFYERREVRDVLAYLKLVNNPRDDIAAQRVINVPKRGIGKTTVENVVAAAAEAELSLGEAAARPDLLESRLGGAAARRVRAFFDMVRGWREAAVDAPVPSLLERILKDIGYAGFLEEDDPETAEARHENVNELLNAAHAFHEQSEGGGLAAWLEQVALVADADTITDEEGLVRLMTIHAAKGLEFPVVVVAGCEENLLPHFTNQDDEDALEEERRLFYVALTRARSRVHLLHARMRRRFGQRELSLPSRFLAEMPAECVEARGEVAESRPSLLAGLRDGWRDRAGEPGPRPPVSGRVAKRGRPQPRTASIWAGDVSQEEVSFREGQAVIHPTLGLGVVARVEGGGEDLRVSVDFPDGERKHFLARFARLRPAD